MARWKKDQAFLDITQAVDMKVFQESVRGAFADFKDPRRIASCAYPAWFLLLVLLTGYLSGCNTLREIVNFAALRTSWLRELTGLEECDPSYSTF
ncbi:MAG: transposase family protein [Verrucomicrobiota bacterium]|nr:transposase family protein [Verrucomicrobiota bacterium]